MNYADERAANREFDEKLEHSVPSIIEDDMRNNVHNYFEQYLEEEFGIDVNKFALIVNLDTKDIQNLIKEHYPERFI